MTKSDFVKIKNVYPLKNIGRKYLQSTYSIKDLFPKYWKTQLNNKKTNDGMKKGQNVWTKIYKGR